MNRRIPKLCRHKSLGLAYATLDGKPIYFGIWPADCPSPPKPAVARYNLAVAAWLEKKAEQEVEPVGSDPTVDELWDGYLQFCRREYVKNGKQTSEVACVISACRVVARLFGRIKARDFGPKRLKRVRREFVQAGWNRGNVNKQTSRVKRMFRWGVEEELFDARVWQRLRAVRDIRAHKVPGLREPVKIRAVADDVIEATLAHAPESLAVMVRVHRRIGCRADEITILRPCDIERIPDPASPTGETWRYTPASSKTDERYWVGPRAQALLKPLIDAAPSPETYLFTTGRRGAGHWLVSSYRRAVERCCRLAGVPRWSPLQIRKAAGQEARDLHAKGLEAAQARLRHKEMNVTERYAGNLDTLGMEVARQLG